jgi:xanthine dehydrogenase accessory factor
MLDELRSKGEPESAFSRLYAPIGLDIGAETPEEIALSTAAEIMAVKKVRMDPA